MSFKRFFVFFSAALLFCAGAGASQQPGDSITQLLKTPVLADAVVGFLIRDLDSGEMLYELNPDRIMIPASNLKLVTAASAILELSPDFRYQTDYFLKNFDSSTGKAGGIYIKGYGDPTLSGDFYQDSQQAADERAKELYNAGLREINGVMWLDGSFFSDNKRPETWEEEDLDWCYAVRPGALSAGGNCILVKATGATSASGPVIEFDPPIEPSLVKMDIKSYRKSNSKIVITQNSKGFVTVSGGVRIGNEKEFEYPVPYPDKLFGSVMIAAMKRAGIKVNVDMRDRKDVPPGYKFFKRLESVNLMVTLAEMEKYSDNFVAEQTLRVLGALRGTAGSHPEGAKVISNVMKRYKFAEEENLTVVDGSGLSRENRLTPEILLSLLTGFYNSYLQKQFPRLLAEPGKKGTLEKRVAGTEAEGRLWAKTGALRGVCSLSGYFRRSNGSMAAFVLIITGYTVHSNHIRDLQDEIVMCMMKY
ncbi:MAG TPA: D-alanyl-D-alanine carboxypeptidase/D-alanyl-D-alanine-endopeptidase [bacterium]|nr:D-alanyl-D-alanine carboxypeptidase/D-alanyl-D-alanine-endopeptidase [bacterium]